MNLYLNCNDNELTFNKKNYLLRAAERLGIRNVIDIKKRDGAAPTDYILNIEPYDFLKGNKWTGVWEIDLLMDRPEMHETSWALSDIVYIAISNYNPKFTKYAHKTKLLFQAVDTFPKIVEPEYDIVLNGSDHSPVYSERVRLWKILKEYYKTSNLGRFPLQQYLDGMAKSKVQFIRSMNTPLYHGELAQRFFECLAIGPVLTNYVDDLKHTGLVESKDYFSYTSDEEMIFKLNILLDDKNKTFRTQMAENGRKKSRLYHTYEHRLVTILEDICSQ